MLPSEEKSHIGFHMFDNAEMDALYATLGFVGFAQGLIAVFIPVYLWNLGLPIWKILAFYLAYSVWYVIALLMILPLIRRLSDKVLMLSSIPFLIAYFIGMGILQDRPAMLYVLPPLIALHSLLFTLGYDINFSRTVDWGRIGERVGVRYIILSGAQLAAPLLGAILITLAGFKGAFGVGTAVLGLSFVPLLLFPKHHRSAHLQMRRIVACFKDPELEPFNLSGVGYAWESVARSIVWPLFIFIAIGSIEAFGSIITLGLLVTALVTYLVGFLSDIGKRRRVIGMTSMMNALVWIVRPLFGAPATIVGSHVGGNVVNAGLMVAWSSQYYKIAKALSVPAAFIMSRELLYHLSRIALIGGLTIVAYTTPRDTFFAVTFIIAAGASLMFTVANKTHTHLLAGITKEHTIAHDH